jgi:hypothetical protein
METESRRAAEQAHDDNWHRVEDSARHMQRPEIFEKLCRISH